MRLVPMPEQAPDWGDALVKVPTKLGIGGRSFSTKDAAPRFKLGDGRIVDRDEIYGLVEARGRKEVR